MTRIGKTYRFEAAHRLPLLPPEHRCHHLHGHNYKIEVEISGRLDERGFVLDFAELDAVLLPLVRQCDHKYLNEVPGLDNPTAEVIADWFASRIGAALGKSCRVRVYENEESWAEIGRSEENA